MHVSFWEQDSFYNDIDFAIIGSGIVGLSSAIEIKNKYPEAKVVVLERGVLPTGASTKNAGFACFGSPTEILDDLTRMPEQEVVQMIQKRWNGLMNLRDLLGDEAIGFEQHGSCELFTNDDDEVYQHTIDNLTYLNELLKPIFKTNVFEPDDGLIETFGFDRVKHLIKNKLEGQIDTGKTMLSLLQLAQTKGVMVMNGMAVKSITNTDHQVEIQLDKFSLLASKVVVATNGFAQQLLPGLDVQPARAQVLITEPIEGLKLKGTFHYQQGYYYFRNVGNRVLFGGGRNLAKAQENTAKIDLTVLIQDQLDELLHTTILPDQKEIKVALRWAGIMGVGNTKTTIVKQLDPNIYCAVRLGGMGIAIGSLIGKEVVEML